MSFMRQNKSKYGSKKTWMDGYTFGSKLEAAVYGVLKLRAKAGELKVLQTQDHVYLSDAEIEYIPDFKCKDLRTGEEFWVEAKGFEAPTWPIKKRLWRYYGPGRLEVWKGNYLRPSLAEVINPKARKTEEVK